MLWYEPETTQPLRVIPLNIISRWLVQSLHHLVLACSTFEQLADEVGLGRVGERASAVVCA